MTVEKHFLFKSFIRAANEAREATHTPTTAYVDEDGKLVRGGGFSTLGAIDFGLRVGSITGKGMEQVIKDDPKLANLVDLWTAGAIHRSAIKYEMREEFDKVVSKLETDLVKEYISPLLEWKKEE